MDYRKLDALVAKTVMGWTVTNPGSFGDGDIYVSKPISPGHTIHTVVPFRPSRDIAYAWLVVVEMKAMGRLVLCGDTPNDSYAKFLTVEQWEVRQWDDVEEMAAPTAPLAICLAALKVFGVDVSEFEAA